MRKRCLNVSAIKKLYKTMFFLTNLNLLVLAMLHAILSDLWKQFLRRR